MPPTHSSSRTTMYHVIGHPRHRSLKSTTMVLFFLFFNRFLIIFTSGHIAFAHRATNCTTHQLMCYTTLAPYCFICQFILQLVLYMMTMYSSNRRRSVSAGSTICKQKVPMPSNSYTVEIHINDCI